jgi:hypothetical protein
MMVDRNDISHLPGFEELIARGQLHSKEGGCDHIDGTVTCQEVKEEEKTCVDTVQVDGHSKFYKPVKFYEWVRVRTCPEENRQGTHVQDAMRWRQRIEASEKLLAPVLRKHWLINRINSHKKEDLVWRNKRRY